MIRLLTVDKLSEFSAFCDKSIPGAVIHTRLLAYGINSNEALFWYSLAENGSINGVFSMTDGVFLACADKDADTEEIGLFAKTVGASEVTYGKAKHILKYVSGKDCSAQDITGENIKDVFDVVFEDDKNRAEYFAKWYTDASHKVRHSLIHGKCICENGKCVSVALTSGETDSIAVISSVATLKAYRKQGLGERTVLSLAQSLGKDVYLMTDNEKTKKWYVNIGFEEM